MKTEEISNNSDDLFRLLKSKDIIAILDGDKDYGTYNLSSGRTVKISMPYQSGRDLCNICNCFGYPMTYKWGESNLSRWQYLDMLIDHCINTGRCSELISFLFSKKQFSETLNGLASDEIEEAYQIIIKSVVKQINGLLYFGGNELTIFCNRYIIHPIGTEIHVDTPEIKIIDREYIKSISERAMQDIEKKHYDSAITKSRTLLEETFCYVIEKKQMKPSSSGKINVLYNQVKDLYNMHEDHDTDKRINMLLSGLEKIISSVSEMRNSNSDAHGVGASRIPIKEYHARLFVNASMTMADFILAVAEEQNSKK